MLKGKQCLKKKQNIINYYKNNKGNIFLFTIIFLIFIYQLFFFKIILVSGISMEPTFYNRDFAILDRQSYKEDDPSRFDIVTLRKKHKVLIKRVIGLPNECVQIKNGFVYINDQKLEEDIRSEIIKDPGIASEKIYLGEDEYFVLGDNRNYSYDSRKKNIGIIKENEIQGQIIKLSDEVQKTIKKVLFIKERRY